MKSIGFCYNEQAVKVSNSHNSTPSNDHHQVLSLSNCYKVKLSTGKQFLIKLTWSKSDFSIAFSEHFPFRPSKKAEKIIFLQRARGTRYFELFSSKVEVYWDFCHAQYEYGPEPITGFYVLVILESEVGLVVGDMEHEKGVSSIRFAEFKLISRCEVFSGYACYSGRVRFSDTGKSHDILIMFTRDDVLSKNWNLSINVDKKSVVEVKRLRWNFRGNETIFVDGLLVDLMWDVYDWLFGPLLSFSSRLGHGVFLFRTRSGLNSRLWLEDKKINVEKDDQLDVGFSFMIRVYKNHD